MKPKKHLTAYPVLAETDGNYIDSKFIIKKEEKTFGQSSLGRMNFDCRLETDDQGLLELISQGKACYVVHIECPLLAFREVYKSGSGRFEIAIDTDKLANKVEFSSFIVAVEDIEGYTNKNFEEFFRNKIEGYHVQRGGVLAIGSSFEIDLSRNGKIPKKMVDIIVIQEETKPGKKGYSLLLDNNKIIIQVSKKVKDAYATYGRCYLHTVLSSLLVPAMQEILWTMKEETASYEGYHWYGVIKRALDDYGVNIEQMTMQTFQNPSAEDKKKSIPEIAQAIFKYPLDNCMVELGERGDE